MNLLVRWLALRNFRFKKGYNSFGFFISVFGVIIGVAALIVVNAVMTGFQNAIKERLLSGNGDIIIMKGGRPFDNYKFVEIKISKLPHVKEVEPFIYVPAMVASADGSSGVSGSLRGCIPTKEEKITGFHEKLILGDWESFKKDPYGVLIGKTMAENLGVTIGDKIKVISPIGRKTPFGIIPRTATFRVVGIFEIGMYQFDSSLVLSHLETVKKKFGFGSSVTGLMVKIDNLSNLEKVKSEIKKNLGKDYVVEDWISLNKNLFSALKLEKLAMFLILTLIVIVASFNISSLLMMNVKTKAKEIAILKALGGKDSLIVKIFLTQGLAIGVMGTVIGELLGITVSFFGEKFKLIPLPPDVYYIDHLPFKLQATDCVTAALVALTISVVATIYPSLKGARENPVKVLRGEE